MSDFPYAASGQPRSITGLDTSTSPPHVERKSPPPLEEHAPPHAPEYEALEIARSYATEEGTRLGILSRALLSARGGSERWGLIVRPSSWLEDTCAVQRNAYDLEPEGVPYIKEQATAAIVELAELLQALPWKGARDGTPSREPTEAEISHAKEELVDTLIFIGNIGVALGFTDKEIWDAVNQKACKNVSKRAGLGKEFWK